MRSDTECHPPSLLCSISIKIFHFHQLVLVNILTIDILLSSASSLRITVSLGCWYSIQRHHAEGIRGAEIRLVLSLQLWALAWWLHPPWGTIFPNSHSLHYRLTEVPFWPDSLQSLSSLSALYSVMGWFMPFTKTKKQKKICWSPNPHPVEGDSIWN